jgi:Fic family protein
MSFRATSINDLDAKFWMLVGEARSKCEHLAGTPLKPQIADELWRVTLIKGAQATTAIEGNTLTEEQVEGILDGTYKAPPSRQYQEQEVRNVLDALMALDDQVLHGAHIEMTPDLIRSFNKQVLGGIDPGDERIVPGEFRSHSVGVGNYRGAPAEDCAELVAKLCDWLEGPDFRSDNEEIQFALILAQAVLAHLYLAWIHPFGDGNGRVARLVEFLILARSGRVPLPAAHLLSNHYNLTRDRYYAELDRASRADGGQGDIKSFLTYAVQGFVDGIREEIARVREQQFHVAWVNYVHEQMATFPSSKACDRQRALVLALELEHIYKRNELATVSPKVAQLYAGAGPRTLARDVNRLFQAGLIRRVPGGFMANSRRIAAFLPPMADPH